MSASPDQSGPAGNPDVLLVLTTVPSGDLGETLARTLVEERLAACVNLLAPMTSYYHWNGTVERDTEQQVLIKTTRDRLPALQARIAELHSYDLPEFVVISLSEGGAAYLDWVRNSTRSG